MKNTFLSSLLLAIFIAITTTGAVAADQITELKQSAKTHVQRYNFIDAIKAVQKIIELSKKKFGDNHNETLEAMLGLARLYLKNYAIRQAESVCLDILKHRPEPGDIHFEARNVLARVKMFKGEIKEGEKILLDNIKIRQALLKQAKDKKVKDRTGKELWQYENDVDKSKRELALFYASSGQHQIAEKKFLEAIKASENKDDNGISLFFNLQTLGEFYRDNDQTDKAVKIYERMVVVKTKYFGPQHVTNHSVMLELVKIYYTLGQFNKAEEKLKDALKFTETYPDGPLEKSGSRKFSTVKKLGFFYSHQKRYPEAISQYQRALAMAKEIYGKTDPQYRRTMTSLAGIYQEMKDYEKAELYFKQSLQLGKEINNEQFTLACKKMLAGLYADQGKKQKAITQLTEALALSNRILGQDSYYTRKLQRELSALTGQ